MTVERELIRPATTPKPWWEDFKRVADLGRWLEEQGEFRTPEARWYFIEKVQSRHEGWAGQYEDMCDWERAEEQERLLVESREERYSL